MPSRRARTVRWRFSLCSLALDWKSKLAIRMVVGFAELAERKENRGCEGTIRTE